MKPSIAKLFLLVVLPMSLSSCGNKAHTHQFNLDDPKWEWASDYKSASLKFKCLTCDEFSEPKVDNEIDIEHVKEPTCTEKGQDKYIASVDYEGKAYTDSVVIDKDELGHDFTSIEVDGVKDSYPALTEITGLTVNKVCSRGDKVLASDSEVEIVYSHGDGKLHADDNSFEVKVKGTALKKTVDVTVNKVEVEKPTADTRTFVYNATEQEYYVAESDYYTVTGNKKINAGTTKVTVSLLNKTDCEWTGGGVDDIEFDFKIDKGTPVISGLENSYSIKCKGTVDFSGVTSTLGKPEVKILNDSQEEADPANLTAGNYTIKATVAATDNYNSVEKTASLTVSHDLDTSNPIWEWSQDHSSASLKFKCKGCDGYSTPVVDNDITPVHVDATCTEDGSDTYTASVEFEGKTYTDEVVVPIGKLGHDFTSIKVEGASASYDALTSVTGLTVTKVCSRGCEVTATSDEYEIVYSHGDGKLHADDTSFTVRLKDKTSVQKVINVTVNTIKVTKPEADTSDFVYNATEQEYHVADNEHYTVTGNKKTDAGTTKVTVSLVDKTDYEWADGGTDDIQFDFTIAKGTPVISGLEDSYSIKCLEEIDFSGVTTTLGEVEVKVYDSDEEEVAVDNLTAGEYTVKATVEGTANYNSAEATSTITVTHKEQTINPDGYIGNIIVKCENCGAIISKTPMQESELITDDDYGYSKYGCDGATIVPSDLASEFPEYASSTKKAYSGWSFNNEEKTLAMPKIEYSAYEKVSILLHTNSTNAQFISFGTSTSNDLIDFDNHGAHTSYALNCVYDEGNEKLDVTINSSIGEENSFVVNDTNVINGISALQIKAKGGAYRTIVLDSVRLNHTCSNFVDCSSNTIISESKVCEICNKYQSVSSDEKVYGTDYFANDKLNIKGDNGLALGIDSEDVGAIKIGGSQGAQTEANIYLPYVNYTHINNLVVTFSCNAAGSKIGFDASNRVETVGNTKATDKGTIRLRYENEKLIGSLFTGSGSVVTKEITDAWVINGHAQLKLNVLLNAWHYIAISKVVVNEAENNSPDVYNTSMKNELTATTYSTDKIYDCFGGRGKQYHSIDNTDLQTISIPKINFKYESIIIEGAFNQGSKIGFDENDLYNTSSAGGSKEYYTVEYSGTSDGKINAKVTIYESCDPDGEGKVGDQSDHTAYTRFKTVLGSKEFTIDNADIYNGTAAASFLFSVNHTWNTNFYIAVAKVSLI